MRTGMLKTAGLVLALSMSALVTPASAQVTWEVSAGSKVPTPISATAVRGRMPGFLEPNVVYVLTFVNFSESLSRQAITQMDQIATEHGKKVSVVAITDEGVDVARKFVESAQWAPRIGFVVAADPGRSATRTFFGPKGVPSLPVSFVMRDGIVQWSGTPAELAEPVAGCVRGTWDIAAARRSAEQRELWKKMLAEVEQLAKAKQFEEALSKLQSACESAIGDQQGQCLGARFSLLVQAGRMAEGLAVGDKILAAPMNARQPAGLAWTVMTLAPNDASGRVFALKAAAASDTALRSRDPMVGAILARAQHMNGQKSQSIETARRALTLAVDSPELANALREDLRQYEGGMPVPPASSGPTAPPAPPVAKDRSKSIS